MRKCFHEKVVALLLDVFEGAFCGRGALACIGEVCVDGGKARFGCGEAFACAHVGGCLVDVGFEACDLVGEFEFGFFEGVEGLFLGVRVGVVLLWAC
jgi:hypothetical protein